MPSIRMRITNSETKAVNTGIAMISGILLPLMPMTPRPTVM